MIDGTAGRGGSADADPVVLIVEDEAILALGLAAAVTDAGYAAAVAASATAARDLVSFTEPAVAVVDLRLRDGITGPDLVRDLSRRGVPVIVFSGEISGRFPGLPAFSYISKPAAAETVVEEIRAALGQRRSD